MKTIFVLFMLLFSVTALSQEVIVKSLRTYPSGNETAFPLIVFDKEQSGAITIEFDVESNSVPEMHIIFRFCDKNWIPVDNAFLANNGKNTAYILDYNSLPVTVENARYNFKNTFPDAQGYVDFPYSGKWIYFITDASDQSIIYGSGKFYVVYNEVPISTTLKKEQLEDKIYFPSDLAKVFNVTTELNLPDELFPGNVYGIEIIENRKISQPVLIGKDFNTNTRQFYWDGNRRFTFTARDIRPGNGYRSADFRNANKFNSKSVRAQFDGLENSRFFKSPLNDLDGASALTKFDDPNSTYLDVNFSIRPPDEVSGNIFLTGAFNNWQLLPEYELQNKAGIYSLNILLKRGIYDYQYVVADKINNEIKNPDWYVLEGNNWDASNQYHVFLYYNTEEFGGYDKIIGYSTLKSR